MTDSGHRFIALRQWVLSHPLLAFPLFYLGWAYLFWSPVLLSDESKHSRGVDFPWDDELYRRVASNLARHVSLYVDREPPGCRSTGSLVA
jgi:hypothetical protein